jgi:hypothetical protein
MTIKQKSTGLEYVVIKVLYPLDPSRQAFLVQDGQVQKEVPLADAEIIS